MKLYKFGVMLLGMWCSLIMAQTFPNKSVRMVVPYTTGGGTDAVARALSQQLSKIWGQTVVV